MFGPDDADATPTRPTRPPAGTANQWFEEGNLQATPPQRPTLVRQSFMNIVLAEIRSLLAAAGIVENKTDDTQVLQAIRFLFAAQLQVFTASTSCTVPVGRKQALVLLWGGGGGGGGSGGAGGAASGAGGGEWRIGLVTGLTGNQVIPVTISLGGVAGGNGSAPTNGGAGGDSSFGAYIVSKGGGSGTQALNGVQAMSTGAGGTNGSFGPTVGGTAITGVNGGTGQTFGTNVVAGGQGGGAFGSSSGQVSIQANGLPGIFPGGGGNGGSAGGLGGRGADGLGIVLFI